MNKFYIHPPYKPIEPSKKIITYKELENRSLIDWNDQIPIPKEANYISSSSSFEGSTDIQFLKGTEIDNPDYSSEYQQYEKDIERYASYLKNPKEWVKIEQLRKIEEAEAKERKTFEKLKKKYEL